MFGRKAESGYLCSENNENKLPSPLTLSMKREVYESQKAFAGEKKPSMQRRCVDHDYTSRQMYMVTMVTEGRRPLFGEVVGCVIIIFDSCYLTNRTDLHAIFPQRTKS